MSKSGRWPLVSLLILAGVLFLAHRPVFGSPEAGWADFLYVLGNWGLRDVQGLGAVFSGGYSQAFWYGNGDWVPVSFLVFYAQSLAHSPAVIRACALALLALDAWLVSRVAQRLFESRWAGLLSGLIFGLHPAVWGAVHVSWECHELACLFVLAAFLAHLNGRRSWPYFGLALLSKQTSFILPGLILAYELAQGKGLRRALRCVLPHLAVLAVYGAAYWALHFGSGQGGGFDPGWTLSQPMQKAGEAFRMLFPYRAFSLCLLAVFFCEKPLFLGAWILIASAPFMNLLPLQALSRVLGAKPLEPRYVMLACAGLAWAVSSGLLRLRRWSRPASVLGHAAVLSFAAFPLLKPIDQRDTESPMTALFTAPFLKERGSEGWRERYGDAAADVFERTFGSGLVYSDPHVARYIRNLVHRNGLYSGRVRTLPDAFVSAAGGWEPARRDWELALRASGPEEALARSKAALESDKRHVGALLLASLSLDQLGRKGMASRLMELARRESGLNPALAAKISGMPAEPVRRLETDILERPGGTPPMTAEDEDLGLLYVGALQELGSLKEAEQALEELRRVTPRVRSAP
ncbi:MAG: hypothetical protein WC728_10750 [Elusimicrobiota bacterium]